MFVIVAIVQALSGLGLIFLVLLHSGKGGGLSDMFGGGIGAQTAGSTVVEQNLDRITARWMRAEIFQHFRGRAIAARWWARARARRSAANSGDP